MKAVGVTSSGSVLVEMDVRDLRALNDVAVRMGAIAAAVPEIATLIAPPVAETPVPSGKLIVVRDLAPVRSKLTKPAKTGTKPDKPDSTRKCEICGKLAESRRKACPGMCEAERKRRYANAWYAAKHPTAKKPAPTATPVQKVDLVLPRDEAHDRIRAALNRTDAKLATGAALHG